MSSSGGDLAVPQTEGQLEDFKSDIIKARDRPIKIYDSIKYVFEGETSRTKRDFLDQYFEKAVAAKTFGELTNELQEGVMALRGTNIFKKVKVNVSELPPVLADHLTNHCVVTVELVERKWWTVSGGMYFSSGIPEVQVEGGIRNVGGRGETLFGRLSTTPDTDKSFSCIAGISKPILIRPLARNAVLHVMAHNSMYDNLAVSNYIQRAIGGNIRIDMLPHSLSYDGVWRRTTLGQNPSPELVRDEGESIKSSIRYTFTRDFRDNVAFPTTGRAYQFSTEVAGLGGDVKFLKNEFTFNQNFPFFKSGVAFNYVLKGGLVHPLSGDHTRVCDRFFMGGVGTTLSLRGFKNRGIDNGNERESHGGDMYYTTAAHVTFPLPFLSHYNFIRAHVFANAGNLVNVKNLQYREAAEELKDRARSAVGAGIIFTTPIGGRFEFNFCRPLSAYVGDKVAKGFQFGVAFTL